MNKDLLEKKFTEVIKNNCTTIPSVIQLMKLSVVKKSLTNCRTNKDAVDVIREHRLLIDKSFGLTPNVLDDLISFLEK